MCWQHFWLARNDSFACLKPSTEQTLHQAFTMQLAYLHCSPQAATHAFLLFTRRMCCMVERPPSAQITSIEGGKNVLAKCTNVTSTVIYYIFALSAAMCVCAALGHNSIEILWSHTHAQVRASALCRLLCEHHTEQQTTQLYIVLIAHNS